MMFELTYRCNFRCPHCYVPLSYRKRKELKTKEVFSILEQLKGLGCLYLGFTGGEPFIRKDILKILRYAGRCGFEIIIHTNGSLFDGKMAKTLAGLRLNKVDVTIPAMNEAAFGEITGVAGAYRKAFRAVELLNKYKVPLGFKTCVLRENQDQIKAIQDFATSLGASPRLDDLLWPRLNGSSAPYRFRGIFEEETVMRNASHVARNTSHLDKLDTCCAIPDTRSLFKCGVGQTQAAITPQGELKPCLMIDYPRYKILNRVARNAYHVSRITSHVRRYSVKTAWESLKEFVATIKPDKNYKCLQCNLQPFCRWCPARAWLYKRSFTSCDPQSLRDAKRKAGRWK